MLLSLRRPVASRRPRGAAGARRAILALACLLAALRGQAQERQGGSPATDNELRIQGVFNTELPGTERKHALHLVFHPHIGDLVNEDYLRIPFGVRYGLSSRFQISGATETYFSHGLGDTPFFQQSGFSQIKLGAKYALGDRLVPGWDLSVGAEWSEPLGTPPADITDGMEHRAPFVSYSHWLDVDRRLRFFGSVKYDDVTDLGIPRHLEKNELSQDSVDFTVGILRQRGDITYTFETGYATTRFTSGGSDDVFMIRPGLVWVVPRRYTFWATGKWLLGSSLRLGYGPDGAEVGVGVKLRVNFDLKRLVGRRPRRSAQP